MTSMSGMVARRALLDYARKPLNLVMLVLVPVVLVFVWGPTLADFSKLSGGSGDHRRIEAATAGWAAAALAGLAGFFQITGARAADRRLAAASHRTAPVVAGRLGASVGLAVLAAAGGLVALAARVGISDPLRAISATLVVAVIYLAFGVLVGTFVKSEMNGSLLVSVVWVFDVFLGPALTSGSSPMTRVFPLHFPTLVLTAQASRHAGPVGDVGWSLVWALGLSIVAVVRLVATTRPAPEPDPGAGVTTSSGVSTRKARLTSSPSAPTKPAAAQTAASPAPTPPVRSRAPAMLRVAPVSVRVTAVLRAGMREYRRNRVLWVLLLAVPALFIGMAIIVTVDEPGPIALVEGARHFTTSLSQRRMHAATMVPVASAFLAGLTGLFIVTGSATGDRRLVLAGFRPREVLAGRLGVIGAATVLATTVGVAVSGAAYAPRQWVVFAGANLLIALTYAMVGVLVGPLTGRLGGLYLILLLAFIDVGLGQSVMVPGGPPAWGAFLPARGASRVMIDGAFTGRFDEIGYLVLGLGWLATFVVATTAVFDRRMRAARRRPLQIEPAEDYKSVNGTETIRRRKEKELDDSSPPGIHQRPDDVLDDGRSKPFEEQTEGANGIPGVRSSPG